jgi:hypothetical protein
VCQFGGLKNDASAHELCLGSLGRVTCQSLHLILDDNSCVATCVIAALAVGRDVQNVEISL